MSARLLTADGPAIWTLAVAEVPAQPWRNGGGLTRELLTWPPGAADWQLRLSVADIEADGPFSAFAGVQRHFVVLKGAGVWLGEGATQRRLGPEDEPFCFAGEEAPACRLIAGPTVDLNLMLRRDAGRAQLLPVQAGTGQRPPPGSHWRGLFCADAALLQRPGQAALTLAAMSLCWSEEDLDTWLLQPAPDAGLRAWALSLQPHAAEGDPVNGLRSGVVAATAGRPPSTPRSSP